MTQALRVDDWTGRQVTIAGIERQLARLRDLQDRATKGPDLRTSVMTHMAWVPPDWLDAARETLAGLAERHPSRTILLVPEPAAGDALHAELALQCFPLPGGEPRHVCSEVIELWLCGARCRVPASIVEPLLLADLPVFLRWRGEPPFGGQELDQLLGVTDRLVVDSSEWTQLPDAYARFAEKFEQTAASDIAWARTLGWRVSLAARWPGIAKLRKLEVKGPLADALLLAGWLRSRLAIPVELVHEPADQIESVEVDGQPVEARQTEPQTPSDLLSDELDNFARDPVYEESVRATSASED